MSITTIYIIWMIFFMLPGHWRTLNMLFILAWTATNKFYAVCILTSLLFYISLISWALWRISGPIIIEPTEPPLIEEVISPVIVVPENPITPSTEDNVQSITGTLTEPEMGEVKGGFPCPLIFGWGLGYLIGKLIFRN